MESRCRRDYGREGDPALPQGGFSQLASTTRWPYRPLLVCAVLFVIAAGLRVAHYADLRDTVLYDQHIYLNDARYYDMLARRIVSGNGISDDVYFMAPLYPYVLSVVYGLYVGVAVGPGEGVSGYGSEIHLAAYLQCLWGAATCVLIYLLGRRLAGNGAGIIAGLIAAVYGAFIFHDAILMATQLITFVNVAALLVLLRASRTGSLRWWIAGGAMLGLCALAHGTALLLVPCVVIWILVGVPNTGTREKILHCAVVCLTVGVIVGLVTVRNYVVGRDWVLLTSNSGLTFYIGNNEEATGTFQVLPTDLGARPGIALAWQVRGFTRGPDDPKPSENSRALRNEALKFIAANPVRELQLLWRKFRLLLNRMEIGTNDNIYFHERFSSVLRLPLATFGLIAPIALTGFVCSLGRWREFLLLQMWLLSQVAVYTLMFVLGRYRMVAVVCLMVLVGFQVVWWIEAVRAKRFRAIGLSLIALILFSVLVHLKIPGFDRERGFGEQYALLGRRYTVLDRKVEAIESLEEALQHDFAPRDEDASRLECLMWLIDLHAERREWDEIMKLEPQAAKLLEKVPVTRATQAEHEALKAAIRRAGVMTGSKP